MRTIIFCSLLMKFLIEAKPQLELKSSFTYLGFENPLNTNPSPIVMIGSTVHILAKRCI